MKERHGSERDAIIARLHARYGDTLTIDEITATVHAAFEHLTAHAKFDAYLPVLAERAAAERLATRPRPDDLRHDRPARSSRDR